MAFAGAGIELPGDPVAVTLSDVLQRRPLRRSEAEDLTPAQLRFLKRLVSEEFN